MDVDKRKSQFHSLVLGEAMAAAAEDYKKELLASEKAANAGPSYNQIDVDDLLNDPDLEKLHEQRLAQLKEAAEKRSAMQIQGHGSYEEVQEGDFLELVTKTSLVVVHFFHRDFERCKIIDRHLSLLSKAHFDTRFIKLSAPDAPFFVEKLQVRTLPCILCFINGISVDRIVGFEELGARDDFTTDAVEKRLIKAAVIKDKSIVIDGNENDERVIRTMRKGIFHKTESDEDSDFD